MKLTETDFLVIGSGIAGLSYAINIAEALPSARITIITKTDAAECNTRYAQGGIAAVMDADDDFEDHIRDTLVAGDGLCDEKIVRMVVKQGPDHIRELIQRGVFFDRTPDDLVDLALEGGHNRARVLHKGDHTGLEIESALLKRITACGNINLYKHYFALDLITAEDEHDRERKICLGAYVADKNTSEISAFSAGSTLLATGGIGQLFQFTTNPPVATGDGIAMAYRAGARIRDMEFLQYHPTALKSGNEGKLFLISEAVRGCGAILRRKDGMAFMHRYDPRAELASRDIVSRAIAAEIDGTDNACVYLDCTMIPENKFSKKFPVILDKCKESGIDPFEDLIPVVPAMHYLCGGIKTDDKGRTNIGNLYACGECASTGLHGANRLASNSLLEAVVFARRAADESIRNFSFPEEQVPDVIENRTFRFPSEKITTDLLRDLQKTMQSLGLMVNDDKLNNTSLRLKQLTENVSNNLVPGFSQPGAELMNLLAVARLVLLHSSQRTINKGGFFNEDLKLSPKPASKENKPQSDFSYAGKI